MPRYARRRSCQACAGSCLSAPGVQVLRLPMAARLVAVSIAWSEVSSIQCTLVVQLLPSSRATARQSMAELPVRHACVRRAQCVAGWWLLAMTAR